jgi:uncharacterized protein YabN with tetrapyrrole methylase and pyrophosphatase domain
MKQTAVEWLVEKLTEIHPKTFEQAKAIEKEQIKNAWDNGWHEHMNPSNTYITSVKYYNETFKSE